MSIGPVAPRETRGAIRRLADALNRADSAIHHDPVHALAIEVRRLRERLNRLEARLDAE